MWWSTDGASARKCLAPGLGGPSSVMVVSASLASAYSQRLGICGDLGSGLPRCSAIVDYRATSDDVDGGVLAWQCISHALFLDVYHDLGRSYRYDLDRADDGSEQMAVADIRRSPCTIRHSVVVRYRVGMEPGATLLVVFELYLRSCTILSKGCNEGRNLEKRA